MYARMDQPPALHCTLTLHLHAAPLLLHAHHAQGGITTKVRGRPMHAQQPPPPAPLPVADASPQRC